MLILLVAQKALRPLYVFSMFIGWEAFNSQLDELILPNVHTYAVPVMLETLCAMILFATVLYQNVFGSCEIIS